MTGFGTSREAMAAGAVKVDEAAGAVQGHITALRGEVEQMLAGWQSDASGAFATLHQNFEAEANKINTALRNMHEALVSTHATYNANEEQQTSAITGMAGQING